MKQSANARFAITKWEEAPYSEGQGEPKLTRASVSKTYSGDIEGEGHVDYLMMYRSDGSAAFVGLERFAGRIRRQDWHLCAPAHRHVRERAGEGVLFRYTWLRNR